MAQTFDIRFARSAGLAALLEVPENVFRWRGGGLLKIDAHGISIGVKRSLLALFGGKHTQRIPTENLRAVYREGEALRVEFQSGESARVVLPFWADDRDIAAQIVRLLPTSQTVEIEHSTDATHSGKPRADWRVLLSLGVAFAAIAVGTWAVYQRTNLAVATPSTPGDRAAPVEVITPAPNAETPQVEPPAPPVPSMTSSARRVEAPAFPLDSGRPKLATRPAYVEPRDAFARSSDPESSAASIPASATTEAASPSEWRARLSADGVVPYVSGTPTHEAAVRQLDLFLAESDTLRGYFREARYATNSQRFEKIGALWEKVTIRVSNSPDFEDPALRPLQEIELAVSRAWRRAFSYYGDPALLGTADVEVEFAEMLEKRARQFAQ